MGPRQCDAMVTAGEIRPLARPDPRKIQHETWQPRKRGEDARLQGKTNSGITGITGRTRMPAVAALC